MDDKKIIEEQVNKRNIKADVIKGFLICFVLFGHSFSKINSLIGIQWYEEPLNVVLSSFQMPSFMIVSGFFLYSSFLKKDPLIVLLKRIILFVPILIIWEVLPCVVISIISLFNNGLSLSQFALNVYDSVFSDKLWYLSATIIVTAIVCALNKISSLFKNKTLSTMFLATTSLLAVVASHLLKYSLAFSSFFISFFLLGFWANKTRFFSFKYHWVVLAILATFFPIGCFFYKADYSFYLFPQYIIGNFSLGTILVFLFRFLIGVSGFSVLYFVSLLVCTYVLPLAKRITTFGERSLSLYILSMFIQELFIIILDFVGLKKILNWASVHFLFAPLFFIVLFAVCYIVDYFLRKVPRIHRVLLG